ncbi:MAG: PASTA domain-containing protein, partial [Raoultibacter sp.]
DVVGMKKTEAVSELESLGFTVRTTDVKSDDVADTVLLMDPGAGERREEGTEIVLHVAVARTIPDVVGKTQEEAAKIFEDEGFENVEFATVKSNEPEGSVLSADPAAGTVAKSSQRITVTVAQAYTVPDVAGKGMDDAVSVLANEGYESSVVYVYSEATPGTVIATNPKAGTKLESGATVEVQVAKSRSAEIIALTSDYLAGAGALSIGGTTYEIVSVDAAPTYGGGNTAKCAITVRAKTTLDGEVVYGSPKQRTVTVVWTDGNELESIS